MIIIDKEKNEQLTQLFRNNNLSEFKALCSYDICINIKEFDNKPPEQVLPYIIKMLYCQGNHCDRSYIEYLLRYNYQKELCEFCDYLKTVPCLPWRELTSPETIIKNMAMHNNATFLDYLLTQKPNIFSFSFHGIGYEEETLVIWLFKENFSSGLKFFESKFGLIYYLIDSIVMGKLPLDAINNMDNIDNELLKNILFQNISGKYTNHKTDNIARTLYTKYMLEFSLEAKENEKVQKI